MRWALFIYVLVSGGFHQPPVLAPAVRAASFASKDECMHAATTVESMTPPGTSDIASAGMVLVCAPVADPTPSAPVASTPPSYANRP